MSEISKLKDVEFEQALDLTAREYHATLTSEPHCTKATLIDSLVRREIALLRMTRKWELSEAERLRLLSTLKMVSNMMEQLGSDPVRLTDAIEKHFDGREVATALRSRAAATGKKAGHARAENSPLARQRMRIYNEFVAESANNVMPHGWAKRFATRMELAETRRFAATGGPEGSPAGPVKLKTIEKWIGLWRKGQNIPTSSQDFEAS